MHGPSKKGEERASMLPDFRKKLTKPPAALTIEERDSPPIMKEDGMKTFILMTKLSPEVARQVKDRAKLGRAWLDEVKQKCPEVKFIAHYALLGDYDFLDIYEAPDEETAAKVSLISLSNGAFASESWTAIPYKRFLELTEEVC